MSGAMRLMNTQVTEVVGAKLRLEAIRGVAKGVAMSPHSQ
jgi:hypothetical protein